MNELETFLTQWPVIMRRNDKAARKVRRQVKQLRNQALATAPDWLQELVRHGFIADVFYPNISKHLLDYLQDGLIPPFFTWRNCACVHAPWTLDVKFEKYRNCCAWNDLNRRFWRDYCAQVSVIFQRFLHRDIVRYALLPTITRMEKMSCVDL
jgi:hypothetical protein